VTKRRIKDGRLCPPRKRKIITPAGCMVYVDPDAQLAAPVKPKPNTLAPDPTAELTIDERLSLEIAAARPPFTTTAKTLIDSSALPPDKWLEAVRKTPSTGLEILTELELRMLQARLRLVRERQKGELTAKQAAEWGFSDIEALRAMAEYNELRESYKR
jgi:hypothetical protein